MVGRDALAPAGRHAFWAGAQGVYEWDQSLESVHVYVRPPAGLRARDLFCEVGPRRVALGARGAPPFLDAETSGRVKADESFWTLDAVGASSFMWQQQHVVGHHAYTNTVLDPDIRVSDRDVRSVAPGQP